MARTKTFALMGVAGFVAPRHLRAIKDTEGEVICAFDPSDSVGVIDSYFPNASFDTEFEEFSKNLTRTKTPVDYVSICSPNYKHNAQIQFGLQLGADVICEKPLVIDVAHLDELASVEQQTGKRVFSILQLRLHPAIIALKKEVELNKDKVHDVDLAYITSRGAWYHKSWKGDVRKSGGVAANIGVHFFDMLGFLFGELKDFDLHHRAEDCSAGYLEFEHARVRWFLSVNRDHLPPQVPEGQTTYRSITVDGKEIEFSGGFTDLHTESYRHILAGDGFGLSQVRPSIELVCKIREAVCDPSRGPVHPLLDNSKRLG